MRDSPSFTSSNTGWGADAITRSAGGAGIPHLLPLLLFHAEHGGFAEDVELIGTDLEHRCRADIQTFSAPVTFIRVDGNEPFAGTILKTIICDHVISFLIPRGGFVTPNLWFFASPPVAKNAAKENPTLTRKFRIQAECFNPDVFSG